MSKLFQPVRLVKAFLFLLVFTALIHFSSCQPGAAEHEAAINQDSVKPHIMSIEEADKQTANFRAAIDSLDLHVPHFKDSMQFGHAEAFPKDVFRELLRQRNDSQGPAYGIRIYYGRDEAGKIRQILVPYDSNGNDIINHIMDMGNRPASGVRAEALKVSDGQVLENGQRCPTLCGDSSSGLN
jgi:hypothetical protein